MADLPTSPNFDFHDIRVMGPYPTLILHGEPNQATSLELGSLTPVQPHQVSYMIRLNGGELGTPGIEITIAAPAIVGTPANPIAAPAISLTLAYEPGVPVGTRGNEPWFNLTRFQADWLGRPGGAGHSYDHDPDTVGNSSLNVKRRTLRVQMTTHGYVSSDSRALRELRQRFGAAGNPHGRLLAQLTSPTFVGKAYFTMPDEATRQAFTDHVLNHLRRAHQARIPPYHQYYRPVNVVGLEMDPLPGFRRHMMCDRTFQAGIATYSAPHKLLPDTLGRRDIRLVTTIHGVGVCREEQAYDMYCKELEKASIRIRVVRTRDPVLSKATRDQQANTIYGPAAEPADQHVYVGLCRIENTNSQPPIRIPQSGTLAFLSWIRRDAQDVTATGEQAFGMVLHHHARHASTDVDFAMALYLREGPLKQQAPTNPANAKDDHILFGYIRNWQPVRTQLGGIERLGVLAIMNPVLTNLRTLMIPQDIWTTSFRDLSRGPNNQLNPAICATATAWFTTSSLLRNANMQDIAVLNLSSRMDGYVQRIRTTTTGDSAKSVYALMCTLMLLGYRFAVAIDEPAARSEFVYGLRGFLNSVRTNPMFVNRPNLDAKRILSCSFVDVEVASAINAQSTNLSSTDHPRRRKLDLVFKYMLGGLAEEAVLYDAGTYHTSPDNSPPLNCTPQAWSMADCIAGYFRRNPTLRSQYFADRARVLNAGQIQANDQLAIEGRLKAVHQAVFAEQDVVVCDYNTAMSRDIAKSFEDHILILGNTQRIPISKFAAVIVRHSSLKAAILLGCPGDQRFGPMQLASHGQNEAMTSFGRSAWDHLERGSGPQSINVL